MWYPKRQRGRVSAVAVVESTAAAGEKRTIHSIVAPLMVQQLYRRTAGCAVPVSYTILPTPPVSSLEHQMSRGARKVASAAAANAVAARASVAAMGARENIGLRTLATAMMRQGVYPPSLRTIELPA